MTQDADRVLQVEQGVRVLRDGYESPEDGRVLEWIQAFVERHVRQTL